MKAYSIFDDFPRDAAEQLNAAGVMLTIHPKGVARPDDAQMQQILLDYDCVIIGTSQKLRPYMFEQIAAPKIVATASVGLDHIQVPEEKRHLVTVVNTPKANAQSVAEFTIGAALSCCKRLAEGSRLYAAGKNNKALSAKPEDLLGKTIGVIGAGNISVRIMEYTDFFGMNILCWTKHPEHHVGLLNGKVQFVPLDELITKADVISVNLPNKPETENLISAQRVAQMKDDAIFISVSRLKTIDLNALYAKAAQHPTFYVCADIDVDEQAVQAMPDVPNVLVTPHIAGGTAATRMRMFREVAERTIQQVKE